MAKVLRYLGLLVTATLICLAVCVKANAQDGYCLEVSPVDRDSSFINDSLTIQRSFPTKDSCLQYVSSLPSYLESKGFLSASVDSIIERPNCASIYLYLGQQYKYVDLKIRPDDQTYLQLSGVSDHYPKLTSIPFHSIANIKSELLDYFQQAGYPFASVSLDSLLIEGNRLAANLNINKGYLYRFDSIRIFGPVNISKNFIHHYLDIQPGSPYSTSKLRKIDQLVLELPYLQQSQPWDVTMLNTGSLVNLYLQPKKSNQVNVLAGFLPANQQTGGKLLLTVDANLQLQNAFGSGEQVALMWQQIQPRSPRLNLQYRQPYLFHSSFGSDFSFDLYKKDSAFVNINAQLGILYALSRSSSARVLVQTLKSAVLDTDTLLVKATKKLPPVADVSSLNVGLEYSSNTTDYKFNPRRGNEFSIFGSVGNKSVKKSNAITQIKDATFNYEQLYDSVALHTYQLRLRATAAHYFRTGKQGVIKTGATAGWYQSASYYRNELFQIGGYRLLRGFDEESIFADKYAVATIEYRYLLGLNANFFVFSDVGYSSNPVIDASHSYLGAGLGLSFETKGGIFNISYAAGKQNDLPFNMKQSKIHIGFVNIF